MPPTNQIQNLKYCKWHNSYSHYTNNCTIFRNVIQKALKKGRFKLIDKNGADMTIFTNHFPSVNINMVSISAENKRDKKEASSSQPVQYSKQVWRRKLIVVKENTKALSHEGSRKSERKECRLKPKRRIETTGRYESPRQGVLQRLQFPK